MKGARAQGDKSQARICTPQSRHGGNIYAFARERGVPLEDVLDFSASINPLGWPRGVAAAYRQALSQTVHYPEPYAETLIAVLAQYHNLDPRSFVVGNGSTQLIYLLARALKSRRALIVSPTFSEHEAAFRLVGTRVSHFLLRAPTFTVVLEKLQHKLAEGFDTLIITNPNSPTGTLVSCETMQAIVQWCRRLRIQLLVDETFVDWVEEASLKTHLQRQPHLIILRSLTKFFAIPGLRVGYLMTHPRNSERIQKLLEPWAVNTIAHAVAMTCLNDTQFSQRSRVFMLRERQWFERQLTMLPGLATFPSWANFLLLRILKDGITATEMTQRLAAANMLIRDCGNFIGLSKKYVRIAVRRRTENQRLLTALASIVGAQA